MKFQGPMSKHKDAGVHIKGIFLLSLPEGPVQRNDGEGGYIHWLLRERKE